MEAKELLIGEIYRRIAEKKEAKQKIMEEFGLTEEKFEQLVKKMLDAFLDNEEMIAFLCEVLDVRAPRKEKKGRNDYIG